jgi:hypothetical protein
MTQPQKFYYVYIIESVTSPGNYYAGTWKTYSNT